MLQLLKCAQFLSANFMYQSCFLKFLKDQDKSLKLYVLLNGIYWTAQQVQAASIIQKNKTKLRKNRKLKHDPSPLETVQDFLIKSGIKPLMHLLEISIFY